MDVEETSFDEDTRQDNLDLFFQEGRSVICAMDHAVAIAVPGLENPLELAEHLYPYVNGFVVNFGLAIRSDDVFSGKGLCLRTDVYNTRLEGDGAGSISMFGVEDADLIGANAVMNMLYPGGASESKNFKECAEILSASMDYDIPVILEALPKGLGVTEAYTTEAVCFAARLAAELGADAVKVPFPTGGSVDDMKRVVDSTFIPVLVLGGAAMNDDAGLLKMVEDAIQAGAAGVAIGRNIWQHASPARIARSIGAIVHEEATALEGLALMKESL